MMGSAWCWGWGVKDGKVYFKSFQKMNALNQLQSKIAWYYGTYFR